MLMRKKKCLRLFLLSNILLFRYQIILILKIIASYYEKFAGCQSILNEQLNSTLAILTNVIESQTLQGLYSVLV